MTPAVAYLRVSTREQGKSALGLDAQRCTVERIAAQELYTVVHWYTEVLSGKEDSSKRPELKAALAHAERIGGTVLVAKLDRLSRNVHFISGLMAHGVEFRCCDLPPEAPKFMLHIFAVLAEWERDRIAERTREGLAQAKARGRKLGSGRPSAGGKATARLRRRAAESYAHEIAGKAAGNTWREKAAYLNATGVKTQTGKLWNAGSLCRLLGRLTLPERSK